MPSRAAMPSRAGIDEAGIGGEGFAAGPDAICDEGPAGDGFCDELAHADPSARRIIREAKGASFFIVSAIFAARGVRRKC
jgi:hypothetical protein